MNRRILTLRFVGTLLVPIVLVFLLVATMDASDRDVGSSFEESAPEAVEGSTQLLSFGCAPSQTIAHEQGLFGSEVSGLKAAGAHGGVVVGNGGSPQADCTIIWFCTYVLREGQYVLVCRMVYHDCS